VPPATSLSVLFDVFVTTQRVRQLLDLALAGGPLSPDEYAVYSAIDELGPLSATALSRTLGMPLTTVSDYVRALLDHGHATRRRDPRDRRAWLLSLTAEGEAAHRATAVLFEEAIGNVVAAMTVSEADARRALLAIGDACEGALDALELARLEETG
jgi:DNA-binding MarR family transcriptional regulator